MKHFQQAIIRLTGLYVAILMTLSVACSVWLYSVAGQEIRTVAQRSATSGVAMGAIPLQESRGRLLGSLIFFNLFTFGAGTLASYLLAKRTLRPILKSYEAQAQFAADASHQLRTPLTALRAELQLALRKQSAREYQSAITSSLEEVERLSTLTNRLLQLTAVAPSVISGTASLLSALDRTQKTLRQGLTAKRINIILPESDVVLAIYPDDLVELLTIVLDNAIKYSPANTTVTVSVQAERGQAIIRIRDEGPGIAAEDLPHVFERFHRGKSSEKAPGYGLGLAVAKKLAQSAHGHIWAESEAGQGTTVIIQLPISA